VAARIKKVLPVGGKWQQLFTSSLSPVFLFEK